MNIAQLCSVLRASERHHRAAGDVDIADGLAVFANLLSSSEETETVSTFVKRIEKARKGAKPRRARAKRA